MQNSIITFECASFWKLKQLYCLLQHVSGSTQNPRDPKLSATAKDSIVVTTGALLHKNTLIIIVEKKGKIKLHSIFLNNSISEIKK